MEPTLAAIGSPNPISAAAPPAAPLLFFSRDLSWLDFNARVLHEAQDERTPLLERVKFLAIFSSNQDEFFMKRVGWLQHKINQRSPERSLDGQTPEQQMTAVRQRVNELTEMQVRLWQERIRPALEERHILLRSYHDLAPDQRAKADDYFQRQIFPVLTPLAVDPGHPFPFISNLSVSVGVLLRQPGQREHLFARIKVPQLFSRWLTFSNEREMIFVPLESLVAGRLALLFPGMEILEHRPFRVTRNAEVESDPEDPEDLLETVQEELRARRFADTVRVEIPPDMSPEMRQYLIDGLEVGPHGIYELPEPLGMVDLMPIAGADVPGAAELRLPAWKPDPDPALADASADIFAIIRMNDVLVHHPYESFDTSVERFILTAVNDPKVLAIKMTLYRTSGDSPFVPALARAAEAGKQVAVLIELKARFDEERNIRWAQTLENAGAHVVYGVLGLKTHTKTALVVRREDDRSAAFTTTPLAATIGGAAAASASATSVPVPVGGAAGAGPAGGNTGSQGGGGGVRCYAHIATGNYNSKTAQLYTDLGLLTCREDICQDVVDLFAFLTGRSLRTSYRKLLVAPVTMRKRFLELIEREISHSAAARASSPPPSPPSPLSPSSGRIIAKFNALEDREIIEALYKASQAGVKIDLIVRGFCCLRPGVPGLSDNIRVMSVIGRFLEHSRIYYFQNGAVPAANGAPEDNGSARTPNAPIAGGGAEYYLASADWMSRNLSQRVEAAVPVEDPALQESLREVLNIMLEDNRQAWDLDAEGLWTQRRPAPGEPDRGTHQRLMDLTLQRTQAARLQRLAEDSTDPATAQ